MAKIPDLLIVGTDTGVGKTVVSLLLTQWLFRQGCRPFYLKPFQTGCRDAGDTHSDAAFVYGHTPELCDRDPAGSVIYCFPNPKAPYFAARDAGAQIDLDLVADRIAALRKMHGPLVVEAAGGLMVPVTEEHMVVDLIERFDCRPLLVARAGLGTINHTLLSIEVMRLRGVQPIGVVFVDDACADTDPQLVSENVAAVEKHGKIQVFGVIPPIDDFAKPAGGAYEPLDRIGASDLFPGVTAS